MTVSPLVSSVIAAILLIATVLVGCGGASDSPAADPSTTSVPAPTASAMPLATATPAATGLTRDQAIAAAWAAIPPYTGWDVLEARMGRFDDLVSAFVASHMSSAPEPGRLVWLVRLGEQPSPTGGQGEELIIDFWDGHVILTGHWSG